MSPAKPPAAKAGKPGEHLRCFEGPGTGGKHLRCPSGAPLAKSSPPKRPKKRPARRMLSEWLLVRTKGHRERYAKLQVERQGHRAFLPDLWEEGARRTEILFPGYLFVLPKDGQWRFLTGTFGVIGPMMDGERPARVPLRDIRALLGMCDQDGTIIIPAEKFRRGQAVKLKKTNLQGLLGVYIRCTSSADFIRVRLLGKELELEFPRGSITGVLEAAERAQIEGASVRELAT